MDRAAGLWRRLPANLDARAEHDVYQRLRELARPAAARPASPAPQSPVPAAP